MWENLSTSAWQCLILIPKWKDQMIAAHEDDSAQWESCKSDLHTLATATCINKIDIFAVSGEQHLTQLYLWWAQNLPASVLHFINALHARWATHDKKCFGSDVLQNAVQVKSLCRYSSCHLDLKALGRHLEIVHIKVSNFGPTSCKCYSVNNLQDNTSASTQLLSLKITHWMVWVITVPAHLDYCCVACNWHAERPIAVLWAFPYAVCTAKEANVKQAGCPKWARLPGSSLVAAPKTNEQCQWGRWLSCCKYRGVWAWACHHGTKPWPGGDCDEQIVWGHREQMSSECIYATKHSSACAGPLSVPQSWTAKCTTACPSHLLSGTHLHLKLCAAVCCSEEGLAESRVCDGLVPDKPEPCLLWLLYDICHPLWWTHSAQW